MKTLILFLLLASTASAVRMEQVLVEEPNATNRNAAVWSSAPLVTAAATDEYLKTMMATSSYQAALSKISAILAATTERFSTNWSYTFRPGAGVKIDTLIVRELLTIEKPEVTLGLLDTRYLSVTNGGRYGSITAGSAMITGAPIGTNGPQVSSASVVTSSVVSTSYLIGGKTTFNSPAVLFTKPPILLKMGDLDDGGWASASVIKFVGKFSFGAYYDGVLRLDVIRTSAGVVNALVGLGLGSGFEAYDAPTGGSSKPAGVSYTPVLSTHYPTSEPLFLTGFWKRDPTATEASAIVLTSSVARCFSAITSRGLSFVNGGVDVATYASEASLNIDSPSLGAVFRVIDWHAALTNAAASLTLSTNDTYVTHGMYSNSWDTAVSTNEIGVVGTNRTGTATMVRLYDASTLTNSMAAGGYSTTDLTLAVSNYVAATEIMLDPTTGLLRETAERGVVAVTTSRTALLVNYSKFRQMIPDKDVVYRVSMQLSFSDPSMLPSNTPARYWLVMNGKKLLSHRVSASGETGPAFAFIDTTSTTPGYLYLDMSDFVAVHGINVLKSAVYYVKLEALRGLDLWHSQ